MDLNNNLFRVPDLIMKKRNGMPLTADEISFFINALVNKNQMVDPTQIGAMLMAIYFSGMDFNE
jgi:pyrimidine-nucleoside phosphorylase